MASQKIGSVRYGKGYKREVKWNQSTKDVYVCTSDNLFSSNYSYADQTSSASEAMNVAGAFLYNK